MKLLQQYRFKISLMFTGIVYLSMTLLVITMNFSTLLRSSSSSLLSYKESILEATPDVAILHDKHIEVTKAKNIVEQSTMSNYKNRQAKINKRLEKGKGNTRNLTEVENESRRDNIQVNVDWCKRVHVTSTGAFCLNKDKIFDGQNEVWDGTVCAGLEDLFGANASVGDFGAGLGHFGRCFYRIWNNVVHSNRDSEQVSLVMNYQQQMRAGNLSTKPQVIRSWKGYDGALNIEAISEGFIQYLDLSQEHDLGERFDWVMSIEVGEHIPQQYERIFVQNLITHACKGVVLTWSTVAESGHYHVNTHTNKYIIDLAEKMGLTHDPEAQQTLRDKAAMTYLKPGLMVFRVVPEKC